MKFSIIRVGKNGFTGEYAARELAVVVTGGQMSARDLLAIWYRRRYDRLPTRPRGGQFVAEIPESDGDAVVCILNTGDSPTPEECEEI